MHLFREIRKRIKFVKYQKLGANWVQLFKDIMYLCTQLNEYLYGTILYKIATRRG